MILLPDPPTGRHVVPPCRRGCVHCPVPGLNYLPEDWNEPRSADALYDEGDEHNADLVDGVLPDPDTSRCVWAPEPYVEPQAECHEDVSPMWFPLRSLTKQETRCLRGLRGVRVQVPAAHRCTCRGYHDLLCWLSSVAKAPIV